MRSEAVRRPVGAELMRQGEPGDRFFIVDVATLDVVADGRTLATRHAGECVGEIALLRDVPRTATVRAATVG